MFDKIRDKFNLILDFCDEVTDSNWTDIIQKIQAECETAKLELEELEFQANEEA